jgi:hypothetical protein
MGPASCGLFETMAKLKLPPDFNPACAISCVTRRLKRSLREAGFRWRKAPKKSVWWIKSCSGFTTRLSYHKEFGWLVISESPYDGQVIEKLVNYLWRAYVDRFAA